MVEAGELRIGHVEKDRYDAIQKAVKAKELLGVPELLKAAPRDSLVAHDADRKGSERHYLNSYAARLFPDLRPPHPRHPGAAPVRASAERGVDELVAFRELIGNKGMAQFEKDYPGIP